MSFFGPPNIEKLKAKRDIKRLVNALYYGIDIPLKLDKSGFYEAVEIRCAAAIALGDIGGVDTIESLIDRLKRDHVKDVRLAAMQALVRIGKPAVEPLVDVFIYHLDDAGNLAFQALTEIKEKQTVDLLILILNNQASYAGHRARAVGLLQLFDDDRVEEALTTTLCNDPVNLVRMPAITALRYLKTVKSMPFIHALKDEDIYIRLEAIGALQSIGGAESVDPLVQALKDPEWRVRDAAVEALVIFPQATEPIINILEGTELDNDIASNLSMTSKYQSYMVLKNILEKNAADVSLDALASLTRIKNKSVQFTTPEEKTEDEDAYGRFTTYSGGKTLTKPLDCTPLRELAQQELNRRGVELEK